MGNENEKLLSGIVAVGVYLLLIGTVLYYFNYRSDEKSRHYVEKNSNAIAVSLAGATPKLMPTKKQTPKPKAKKSKHKPKKIRNITSKKRAPQKSKKAKKLAKKIQTKSLFASVKTSSKSKKKSTPKSGQKPSKTKQSKSIKKVNNSDKGVEDKYLASVEQKLRGWPEQANFAGEQIAVLLTVYPSGRFDFKVQRLSANSEFNEALIAYLKQLQSIGLGRHTHGKPYVIEVEFEATE